MKSVLQIYQMSTVWFVDFDIDNTLRPLMNFDKISLRDLQNLNIE